MARTTSSQSLALRLPMTSEAPALAIAEAVALPMPVPPAVTMPNSLARDAMSPLEQRGHGDQVPSIFHEKNISARPAPIASVEPLAGTVRFVARGASVIHGEVPITHVAEAHELLDARYGGLGVCV